jgi:hypothetical protein
MSKRLIDALPRALSVAVVVVATNFGESTQTTQNPYATNSVKTLTGMKLPDQTIELVLLPDANLKMSEFNGTTQVLQPGKILTIDNGTVVHKLQHSHKFLNNQQPASAREISGETDNWQTYRSERHGFEFKYPEKLKLMEDGNRIVLSHSIPYENFGDCDLRGGDQLHKTLDDFDVSFEVISQNLTLSHVDGEYSAGILKGSWAIEGAEGCGHTTYHFPAGENKTLRVQKVAVQALSGLSSVWDLQKILRVPGVISREESEAIFNQVLSTFEFLNLKFRRQRKT